MKKFEGTPAPWYVRRMSDEIGECFVEAKKIIPTAGYNIEILGDDANYPPHIKEADCRLIAAAPELLEALQDAVALFEFVISATPTGKVRNAMCDFNIIARSLISKSL